MSGKVYGIYPERMCILLARRLVLLKGAHEIMKELKLDLLPGNLYAAKKRAEQQKDKGKKNYEQKNIVKLAEITAKTEYTDDGENE